jgi:hypothetical protein
MISARRCAHRSSRWWIADVGRGHSWMRATLTAMRDGVRSGGLAPRGVLAQLAGCLEHYVFLVFAEQAVERLVQ